LLIIIYIVFVLETHLNEPSTHTHAHAHTHAHTLAYAYTHAHLFINDILYTLTTLRFKPAVICTYGYYVQHDCLLCVCNLRKPTRLK